MEQPIILDDAIAIDDNQASFVTDKAVAGTEMDGTCPPVVRTEEFKLQEEWIGAIAHCPFLFPDQLWKTGKIQVWIAFIPAEPCIDDELI